MSASRSPFTNAADVFAQNRVTDGTAPDPSIKGDEMTRLPAALICLLAAIPAVAAEWTPERQKLLEQELAKRIEGLSKAVDTGAATVSEYSQRGDAYFFSGEFDKALSDYDRMAELDPELLPLHWRRGLALYYVGRYEDAARQFERYFDHDQVDRENGIWRYYAHVREHGEEKARKLLLPYEKGDRAPLNEIHKLCQGKMTAQQVVESFTAPGGSEAQRGQRLFYGHLYVGLDYAVKGSREEARRHLRQALDSDWPATAGYGPQYMWHVGRLQLQLLDEADAATEKP
jgi:lipoprotein NlpI